MDTWKPLPDTKLSSLAASKTTPKRDKVKKEDPKPKPKQFTPKQAKFLAENLPGSEKGNAHDDRTRSDIYTKLLGYKRRFPHLNFSTAEPVLQYPDKFTVAHMQGTLDDLGNQTAEDNAVDTMKHFYLIFLEMAVKSNVALGNPLGFHVTTLPVVMKKAIRETSFLDQEFNELAILHPEWCRQGPLVRILFQTFDLMREVHKAESEGVVYVSPTSPVNPETKNKYEDL